MNGKNYLHSARALAFNEPLKNLPSSMGSVFSREPFPARVQEPIPLPATFFAVWRKRLSSNQQRPYAKIIVDTARVIRNLYTKGELSSTLSTRETLGAGRMVADGWSVLEAMEKAFLPFYEGSKTEGERSVVYKTFLRH